MLSFTLQSLQSLFYFLFIKPNIIIHYVLFSALRNMDSSALDWGQMSDEQREYHLDRRIDELAKLQWANSFPDNDRDPQRRLFKILIATTVFY